MGELTAEPDPASWDLCGVHVDALTVPRGWDQVDERVLIPSTPTRPSEPVPPPSQPPTAAAAVPPQAEPPDRPTGGRYALLHRDLPRVAAQVAASVPRPPVATPASALRRAPLPSRELAPLTGLGLQPAEASPGPAGADGQLPLGVGGLDLGVVDAAPGPSGVVVPIRSPRGRRARPRDRVNT